MKLRLSPGTMRLRLSAKEVTAFSQTGLLEDSIRFGPKPDDVLCYAIARSDEVSEVSVSIEKNRILFRTPSRPAEEIASEVPHLLPRPE